MPLAVPVLTVADSADGVGGVATVTGGNAAATNRISLQNTNDGEVQSGTWTLAGTRTGDGTVALTGQGYFFAKVESSLAGETVLSNLPYFALTDGQAAVHSRCLDAVEARVNLFTLTDFPPPSRVYKRWLAMGRELEQIKERCGEKDFFPIILICPAGIEQDQPGATLADDVGYPVQVGIVDANNQDLTANLPKYLLWRQELIKAFRNKRLTGVCEHYKNDIEYTQIVESELFKENLFVSGFTVRCLTRKAR